MDMSLKSANLALAFLLELGILAALALTAAGQPGLAGVFALVAGVNTALLYIWQQ